LLLKQYDIPVLRLQS